jgi:hypothetical protein
MEASFQDQGNLVEEAPYVISGQQEIDARLLGD